MKFPEYAYRVSPEAQIPNPGIPALPGAPPTGAGELAAATSSLARSLAEAEDRVEASRRAVQMAQATTDLETLTADRVQKTDSSVSAAEADKQYRTDASRFIQDRVQGIPDERQRNAATAHLMARADAGSVQVRHQANTRIIEDTRSAALPQIEALIRSGNEADLQTAREFIAGLTEGGIFSALEGSGLSEKAKKESLANAFGRILEANPQEAFNRVNERRGIFGQLDDAEHARFVATAKAKAEHETDRAYTLEAHANSRRSWQQQQEDRALKEGYERTSANIMQRAKTEPLDVLIQETLAKGPDGTRSLDLGHMENTIKFLNELKTLGLQSDPNIALEWGAKISSAMTVGQLPSVASLRDITGLGPLDKLKFIEYRNNRQTSLEDRSLSLANQAYQKARVGIEELTSTHGIQDPALIAKASSLRYQLEQDLLENTTAGSGKTEGKEDPWARWLKLRETAERAMGVDVETSARQVLATLPPGVMTNKDIQARRMAGLYRNEADLHRDITAVRQLEIISARAKRFKVATEIVEEMDRQRKLKAEPTAEFTPPEVSNLGP